MGVDDETVWTLLKRPAVEVPPETTLREVAEILAGEPIGAVLVRGPRPAGAPGSRPEGIVSERDIVRALAEGLDPDDTRAEDVMTLDLASVAPGDTIRVAAQAMLANEVRHVPVTQDGVVIGVVSERDALRAAVADLDGRRPG